MMDTARQHALMNEAAVWHDRVAGRKAAAAEWAEFQRWLAAAPEHRSAYDSVSKAHEELLRNASDPRILELRHETALRLTRRRRTTAPGLLSAAAAVALMVGIGYLVVASLRDQPPPAESAQADLAKPQTQQAVPNSFATGVGERLSINLEDGSHVTLSSETQVRWDFSPGDRRVELLRGQALFEVAKDPRRPFVVQAGERQFTALGTAFDVRRDGQFVQITMVEGRVRVDRTGSVAASGAGATTSPRVFVANLSAGEQLTVDAANVDRIGSANAQRVTSWRDGRLIFENSRLADAVVEFNRHSGTRISLADPKLGEVRISGAFQLARPQVFVEALTVYFPIRASYNDEDRVVLAPAE